MGFELDLSDSHVETVNKFKDRIEASLEEAKSALAKAKDDIARYYSQHQTPAPEYHIGDQVFLNTRDIKTTCSSPKLAHHYLGPYVIQWRVGRNAYRLKLPTSMTHIHPVFNIVKLLLVPDDLIPGQQTKPPPPPPEIVDGDEHYMVEWILDSWLIHR